MRLFSFFSSLPVMLFLAGCVSASAQQTLSHDKSVADEVVTNARCNVEKIVRNTDDNDATSNVALDPNRISVLNWNIYKGQRENWITDFKRYSHKHDVVMMQEANLGDELETMLNNEHQYWALNAAFNYEDKATGVMTASRVKPVYSCGSQTLEPWIRFPKTSLISYYPIEGMNQHLLVANIHGINFTFGVDVYRQQLEKLYEVIKHHPGPVVLAGDFNTWSDARMQIVVDLAQRLSLDSLDYTNHNRTSYFGNALDHVFYRGLIPMEHDTWHVTSSDHNPTRVSFRVKADSAIDNDLAAKESNDDNC